jgi:hypothetical protein
MGLARVRAPVAAFPNRTSLAAGGGDSATERRFR